MRILSIFLLFFVLAISGCDTSDPNNSAADNDKSLISSCSIEEMQNIGIEGLDWQRESDICNIMVTSINRKPPVYLLRKLFTVVFLVQVKSNNGDDVKAIAYQAMNIIEARNQENNDSAIGNTLETIWKIYEGTQQHVTFKDLNIALRQSGDYATTISDEGMYSLGALIWEEKKAKGE